MSSTVKTAAVSALFALAVVLLSSHSFILKAWQEYTSSPAYTCDYNGSKMEIISFDPLVMYINDFITDEEINGLLQEGEGRFRSSRVYRDGGTLKGSERTSETAGLPNENHIVQCVKSRTLDFLGTTRSPEDDIGTLQLVRYEADQKFDLHRDWYSEPHKLSDGRLFNRVTSFFAFLDDNCTEGETYFPYIESQSIAEGEERYREHENGGVAFKPIRGNAIFWVNLFANGTGDDRTKHAGLPVADGTKVAMNIWPRKFYH